MKKVMYVILGLIVLYLVLALMGPSKADVVKEITINRPADVIMLKLGDFRFFNEQWNPWAELDTAMKINYKNEPNQVGHYYDWDGNKEVRNGTTEITAITKDSITEKMTFGGRDGGTVYLITRPNGESTTVSWQMKSDFPFFARPFMLFMNMDKMIGGMYEKGLAKLKKVMEEMPAETASKYAITEVSWEERTYVGKKETVSTENNMEKLSAFFMQNYPKLVADVLKNKLSPCSAPSAIYYKWEEKQTEVAAVFCVNKGTQLKGWETFTVPASKVLVLEYFGTDAGSMDAHNAMSNYIKTNNLQQALVIEEYVTDRGVEKDSSKWQTNIYYLVK